MKTNIEVARLMINQDIENMISLESEIRDTKEIQDILAKECTTYEACRNVGFNSFNCLNYQLEMLKRYHRNCDELENTVNYHIMKEAFKFDSNAPHSVFNFLNDAFSKFSFNGMLIKRYVDYPKFTYGLIKRAITSNGGPIIKLLPKYHKENTKLMQCAINSDPLNI